MTPQLKLCLYSALLLLCEWWSKEIYILMAGWLDASSTAAHVSMTNLMLLMSFIPLSVTIVNAGNIGR